MTAKILYVDDDDDVRDVAEMALSLDPGLEVRTCASGMEALSLVKDWLPDIFLLDVMMPEMDGIETFHRLSASERCGNIPAVFMTARAQVHEVQELLDTGALGVISKPFDPMTLSDQVKRYLIE